MKRFGTVSYNIHCNFTNYGSALQTWALSQAINKLGKGDKWEAVLVDYCPDVLRDLDPLNPFKNMWDQDPVSLKNCQQSMPAIQINYRKFNTFYDTRFQKSKKTYTSENFEEIIADEKLDGFVCGSDTIFCIDEFKGFVDGYYANYPCMKNGYSVAYAASFGDSHFTEADYATLNERLRNFKALGLRETTLIDYIRGRTDVPVQRVLDPTLLLKSEDYDIITAPKLENEPYLLLYARRYNPKMEAYAEKIAAEKGLKIIEISLRACNAEKHRMFYEAGVEDFLSLAKHASFIVTNSFHGLIFSVQFKRPFVVFSREQGDTKISELVQLLGLDDRLLVNGEESFVEPIDYEAVHRRIDEERLRSLAFLNDELENCR